MTALRRLIEEALTPSSAAETPFKWLVIALAHSLAGAALVGALGLIGAPALTWAVPLLYFALKEVPDMRCRGGTRLDSLIDTGWVATGCLYGGETLWPLAIVTAATVGAVLRGAPKP